MAYLNGIQVTNFITVTNASDTYATHVDILGWGGHMSVDTATDRNNIPSARRKFGMTVTVTADPTPANNKTYQLKNTALGGTNDTLTDNNNWSEFVTSPVGAYWATSGTSTLSGDVLIQSTGTGSLQITTDPAASGITSDNTLVLRAPLLDSTSTSMQMIFHPLGGITLSNNDATCSLELTMYGDTDEAKLKGYDIVLEATNLISLNTGTNAGVYVSDTGSAIRGVNVNQQLEFADTNSASLRSNFLTITGIAEVTVEGDTLAQLVAHNGIAEVQADQGILISASAGPVEINAFTDLTLNADNLKIENLDTATGSNILYYDPVTDLVTYGLASATTITNGNGITVAGTSPNLGGTITQHTTFDGSGFNISFGTGGSDAFDIITAYANTSMLLSTYDLSGYYSQLTLEPNAAYLSASGNLYPSRLSIYQNEIIYTDDPDDTNLVRFRFLNGIYYLLPGTGTAGDVLTLSNATTGQAAWAAPTGGGGISDGDKGDITVSGSGATWTIDNGVVTLAKMANIATASFIGRVTASTGVPEALTGTQATTLLDVFTTSLKGLAPASGGGTTNFLRADGSWAAPTTVTLTGSSNELLKYNTSTNMTSTGVTSPSSGQLQGTTFTVTTGLVVGSGGTGGLITADSISLYNSALTHYIAFTPGTQSINFITGDGTIRGGEGLAASLNGKGVTILGGNGYTTSGDGNGGSIVLQTGQRRTSGTGSDGNITIDPRQGSVFMTNDSTVPTSQTNKAAMYVNDITAGNAAFHFKTEAGHVIKLYTVNSGSPYSITNVSTTRSYDANAYTGDQVADTLGTLIADLKNLGVIV
jgi:hypothetical protein